MIRNHKPNKRRNLFRWITTRLRRIDEKLHTDQRWPGCDYSPESIKRCRLRGEQLANRLQIMIAERMK